MTSRIFGWLISEDVPNFGETTYINSQNGEIYKSSRLNIVKITEFDIGSGERSFLRGINLRTGDKKMTSGEDEKCVVKVYAPQRQTQRWVPNCHPVWNQGNNLHYRVWTLSIDHEVEAEY